jgi:hypothetical protein
VVSKGRRHALLPGSSLRGLCAGAGRRRAEQSALGGVEESMRTWEGVGVASMRVVPRERAPACGLSSPALAAHSSHHRRVTVVTLDFDPAHGYSTTVGLEGGKPLFA